MKLSVVRSGEVFAASYLVNDTLEQVSLLPGGTATCNTTCTTCAATFGE